jgi:uncharacterized membrane protein YfcA
MDPTTTLIVMASMMAVAAALYTSVGHGGASAYLAIMALFGVSAAVMKPTALVLNLIVATFAAFHYIRAGRFNFKLFLAFALISIPAAYVGGKINLPSEIYKPLVGITLLVAAVRFFWQPKKLAEREPRPPSLWIAMGVGAALGLLAGLSGTGGGIFLSPVILWFNWEDTRKTSGIAASFIVVNSAAGLAGNLTSFSKLPPDLPIYVGAVAVGAILGTWLGVSKLPKPQVLRALGVVLVFAGAKLIFA